MRMSSEQESLPDNSGNTVSPQIQTEFDQQVDWRWIEGEATTLPSDEDSTSLAALPPAAPSSSGAQSLAEHADEVIIASLDNRQLSVNPGGSVTLQITLLNNGKRAARFHLAIECELEPTWVDPAEQFILLQPGEGSILEITIRPPRTSAALAGEYDLTIYADAAEYPGHYAQMQAQLTINPFRELAIGTVQLQSQSVNALRRSVRLAVPVVNQSNIKALIQLSGHEQGSRFFYRFVANQANPQKRPTILLEAGQSTIVYASVRPTQRAWVGAQPHVLRPALLFQLAEEARAPRVAAFSIYDLPFFGIWAIAGLAAAALLFIIGLVTAGVIATGIWWIRQMPTQTQPMVQQVSAPAQAAQPIVVVVPVNSAPGSNPPAKSALVVDPVAQSPQPVNQPPIAVQVPQGVALPSPTPEPLRDAASFGAQGAVALTAPLTNGDVPIITAADITPPKSSSAEAQANPQQPALQPQGIVTQPDPPPTRSNITFAQMFQEIALRYDLNWRMLAAQAYIESGFDSLALGQDGDMGLMQIMPKTWQEFAPLVSVKDPFESYSNTLVAASYLDYLRTKLSEKGYPQQQWMLVAYNWGPDHVLDFLASGGTWETLDPERRKYAEEILRITATIP